MDDQQSERKDEEVSDPNEMRRRLTAIIRMGDWPDGRGHRGIIPVILRRASDTADAMGLRGEDRFVMMTWCLMRSAKQWESMVLDGINLRLPVYIVEGGKALEKHVDGVETGALPPAKPEGPGGWCQNCGVTHKGPHPADGVGPSVKEQP